MNLSAARDLGDEAALYFHRARHARGDDDAAAVLEALQGPGVGTERADARALLLRMLAVAGAQVAQTARDAPKRGPVSNRYLANAALVLARMCRQLDREHPTR